MLCAVGTGGRAARRWRRRWTDEVTDRRAPGRTSGATRSIDSPIPSHPDRPPSHHAFTPALERLTAALLPAARSGAQSLLPPTRCLMLAFHCLLRPASLLPAARSPAAPACVCVAPCGRPTRVPGRTSLQSYWLDLIAAAECSNPPPDPRCCQCSSARGCSPLGNDPRTAGLLHRSLNH